MILYLAGDMSGMAGSPNEAEIKRIVRHKLISYAYTNHSSYGAWVNMVKARPEFNLFIDSGAFSAETLGIKIDLKQYCRELLNISSNKNITYSGLDVIGNASATHKNMLILQSAGLDPLPVFHVGSDTKYLIEYCQTAKSESLGGLVACGNRSIQETWLNTCWSIIKKYFPIKVHAFGMLAPWALERYPFYSADSSSVVMGGSMGNTYMFNSKNKFHSINSKDPVTIDKLISKGSAYSGRWLRGIEAQNQYEDYLTRLWASRGIVWK
jgi:hypothetical protein